MNDYLDCLLHGFGGLSPFCEDFTNPQIELPPPITGTYIRPPYTPPGIIVVPPIETVTPPASVPLPATPLLLLLGVAVLVAVVRRR